MIVPLSDLVELDVEDGLLVPMTDLHAVLGIPERRSGGRPSHFGPQLRDLIQDRITKGHALSGRNNEAKAVLALFEKDSTKNKPPSLSSVKEYVTRVRSAGFYTIARRTSTGDPRFFSAFAAAENGFSGGNYSAPTQLQHRAIPA